MIVWDCIIGLRLVTRIRGVAFFVYFIFESDTGLLNREREEVRDFLVR